MDDVDRHAEAGAEPEQRAGVLGDVGLIEGQIDGHRRSSMPGARTERSAVGIVSQHAVVACPASLDKC